MTVNIALFDEHRGRGEGRRRRARSRRAAEPVLAPRLVQADPRSLPAAGQAERGARPGRRAERLAVPRRRGADGARLCRLVFAALRRGRRSRRRRHDVTGRGGARTAASPGSSLRRSPTPAPLREAFKRAGWLVFVTPKTGNWRIATEGMDFAAYWAARPAQLRNTAKRRAKIGRARHRDLRPLRCARLGRLRIGLPAKLEARGRLLPLPARPRRAGRRGGDAQAGRGAQGWAAGRGAALAGRKWRGDDPQARLCRRRQGDVAGHPARHGDVPPRARRRIMSARSITAPATMPTRRTGWPSAASLWQIEAFNPADAARPGRRGAGGRLGACPARPEPLVPQPPG